MPTVKELRSWACLRLQEQAGSSLAKTSGVDSKSLDLTLLEVDILLGETLNWPRAKLMADYDFVPSAELENSFKDLIYRRCHNEPIAYLIGKKEFRSLEFLVDASVLIPRPETELLVERALTFFTENLESFVVIDVCTGSGAILISLANELKQSFGDQYLTRGVFCGMDISPLALNIAKKNAEQHLPKHKLSFVLADLLSALSLQIFNVEGSNWPKLFLVLANPPYISDTEVLPADIENFEPSLALRGGADGLSLIKQLIVQFIQICLKNPPLKKPVVDEQLAVILMEIGINQGHEIKSLFSQGGIFFPKFHQDYHGIQRVVEVQVNAA